jgi:hypothetical protein
MRIVLIALASLALAACSDAPTAEKAKAPEKPSAPITGRQAFQMTYPSARTWAADCQPIVIRSLNLTEPKSSDGKAGAWEIRYVSESRGRTRAFTWSAIESEGNLHKGVFGTPDEPWGGPHGQEKPFLAQALKIDTPDALATAIEKSGEYLKKGAATKPQISFMCELTQRFPDPAWRVFWGESVSGAEWSVFVDATTGQYLGR